MTIGSLKTVPPRQLLIVPFGDFHIFLSFSIKFHITYFLKYDLLDLVAVLLVHIIAGLLRLVGADQPFLGVAQGLDGFLLALITDLPGLLLAVLGVAILLGLLR